MKKQIWKIIHAFFKVPLFEKLLLYFTAGKYADTWIVRLAPPFYTYANPTYRIASKGALRLHANMHDYNDWKAYWGIKEIEREKLYHLAIQAKTVVDIGTNNGWVLINLADIIAKKNGFIYGFEPFPETYRRCMENIKISGTANSLVFNLGCGETENSFEMEVVLESNSGQNRIVEKSELLSANKTVKVNVVKLDNQLEDIKSIDLIKIDVEGFEMHVLKGAAKLLKKHRPVLFIEINPPLLTANNTSPEEVLGFLKTNYQYDFISARDGQRIDEMTDFNNSPLDVICSPAVNNH